MTEKNNKNIYIVFAEKANMVRKLIAGPTVFICDECVQTAWILLKKK